MEAAQAMDSPTSSYLFLPPVDILSSSPPATAHPPTPEGVNSADEQGGDVDTPSSSRPCTPLSTPPGPSILLNPRDIPPPSPSGGLAAIGFVLKKAFIPPTVPTNRPSAKEAMAAAEKKRQKASAKGQVGIPAAAKTTSSLGAENDGAAPFTKSCVGGSPCIKFAPLPSSGRVKRANSIALGVSSRAALLAGGGANVNPTNPTASPRQQHIPIYDEQPTPWYTPGAEAPPDVMTYKDVKKAVAKMGKRINGAKDVLSAVDEKKRKGRKERSKEKGKGNNRKDKDSGLERRIENIATRAKAGPRSRLRSNSASSGSEDDDWLDEPSHPVKGPVVETAAGLSPGSDEDDDGELQDLRRLAVQPCLIDGTADTDRFTSCTRPSDAVTVHSPTTTLQRFQCGNFQAVEEAEHEGAATATPTPRAYGSRTPCAPRSRSRPRSPALHAASPLPLPLATSPPPDEARTEARKGEGNNPEKEKEWSYHTSPAFQDSYSTLRRRYSAGKLQSTMLLAATQGLDLNCSYNATETETEGGRREDGDNNVQDGQRAEEALRREVERRRREHERWVYGYPKEDEEKKAWVGEEWRKGYTVDAGDATGSDRRCLEREMPVVGSEQVEEKEKDGIQP